MSNTIAVPPSAQNHGEAGLICLPPDWTDFVIFFATNYFTHAATLISHPGESLWETVISTANALFIPSSGALRAFRFLVLYIAPLLPQSGAKRKEDDDDDFEHVGHFGQAARFGDLAQAARAGALCMIVEAETAKNYSSSQGILGFFFGDYIKLVPHARDIHGVFEMPQSKEWILIEVPPNMRLRHYELDHGVDSDGSEITIDGPAPAIKMTLAKSRNIPKILINILQIVWGIITLYKSRRPQINLYGYGAFGLTVAPYTIMGIINLATNLLRPEYANMYLVHTPTMENVWYADGDTKFMGIVARVDPDDFAAFENGGFHGTLTPPVFFTLNMLGYFVVSILPIALVGGFTGFRSGQNTTIPISWIFGWLIVGSVSSLWVRLAPSFALHPVWEIVSVIPLWIPAVGGFVVVAQMLNDFGICTDFDPEN